MFTRKQYKAIAKLIKESTLYSFDGVLIANEFADYFAKDNPRFDRDKFLSACGVK